MKKVDLDTIAAILKVHPRTVLRHIQNDVNAYWAEGHNPNLALADVALAYGLEMDALKFLFDGRDEFFTINEAIDYISITYDVKMSEYMIRSHKYPVAIKLRGMVRYSRKQIANHYTERSEGNA